MIVRNFTEGDRENYIRMAKDFYAGDAVLLRPTDESYALTFSQALKGTDALRGVIIEEDGETVGYALLPLYWSCEAGGMVLLLDELYLTPESRGKKLGTRFMEWLAAEYAGKAKRFRLEVCPKNERVKKLYEGHGFSELDYIQMYKE